MPCLLTNRQAGPNKPAMANTPQLALDRLREGNRRFLADEPPLGERSHDRRLAVARRQRPFAALVGCSDSRVGPETLFGTGLGDLFIVRSAGNSLDRLGLGSLVYAVQQLDVPLIVVLGHEQCGAVQAAIEAAESDALPHGAMAAVLAPIITSVKACCRGNANDVGRNNVARTVAALRCSGEPALADPLAAGRLGIAGAFYSMATGAVDFFDLETRRPARACAGTTH